MPKILLFDSYDSFTYNLKDYLEQAGANVIVVKNDEMCLKEIIPILPDGLLISPGPKEPEDSGNLMEVLDYFYDKIPILGVCLGHQAIGIKFDFKLVKAIKPMHGKLSTIQIIPDILFDKIPNNFEICRYHSLVIKATSDNSNLKIIGKSEEGEIMAIRHNELPIWGVQYHPEAILTQFGHQLIANWLKVVTLQGQ